jgi:hypothetical protein
MQVPVDQLTDRNPNLIEYFIVHHSVQNPEADIDILAHEEMQAQGFVTIGYNAYIKRTNAHLWSIQEGRPLDKLPAAAYGLNTQSYDICVGGNYHPNVANVPTNLVEVSALNLIISRAHEVKAKCPNLKYLIGHRDVATIKAKHGLNPEDYSTACPGDLLYALMHELRVRTGLSTPPEME